MKEIYTLPAGTSILRVDKINMRATLLIVGIFLFILLSHPVSAIALNNLGNMESQTLEVTGSDLYVDVSECGSGDAILDIYVYDVSPGSTVSLTLSRPNGDAWTGSYGHVISGLTGSETYSLGSSSFSREYLCIIPSASMFWIGYASDPDNDTRGIALADLRAYSSPSDACYVPVSYISSLPITGIRLSTDTGSEIRVVVHYASLSAVQSHILGPMSWLDYLNFILSFVGQVWEIFLFCVSLFKFIFVDNFFAVLTLYESVILAYSAHSSRNIVIFVRRVVRYNVSFFTILLQFIFGVANFIYSIIRSINPL